MPVARIQSLGQFRVAFPVLWLRLEPAVLIDGLLGLDFFRGLVLELDFARGRITLAPPQRWWQLWH